MNPGKLFYAVLNMGLGHASRSLPILREFIQKEWNVLLGSNGRALEFLRNELPEIPFVETPQYNIEYSQNGFMAPKLLAQAPRLLKKIDEEQAFCQKIVSDFEPDLIFSDHCYGMYHRRVASYFLSHQIFFELPRGFNLFSGAAAKFNLKFHEKYSKVIIPDFPSENGGLISGKLSRLPAQNAQKYFYGGPLSSIPKLDCEESIDLLVSISGPEPQRTVFEKKILDQIDYIPGKKVVVLGKSESLALLKDEPGLKVYSHVPREKMITLFNCADLIVSRPGYSTLMELAETGKQALLVPTPGQTEQLYLAEHIMKKRWFYCVPQDDLFLSRDAQHAKNYAGLFKPDVTQWSVNNIFDRIRDHISK